MATDTTDLAPEHSGKWLVVILVDDTQQDEVRIVPDRRIVAKPPGHQATIAWILVPAHGLGWGTDGIDMTDPGWDPSWGVPQKVGNRYELTVVDGPENHERYKYTAHLTLSGQPFEIDPEVEYDED